MKEKETLPSVAEKAEVSFAEIPYSPAVGREDMPGVIEAGHEPAAVIRTSTMSIEISNQISEAFLFMGYLLLLCLLLPVFILNLNVISVNTICDIRKKTCRI